MLLLGDGDHEARRGAQCPCDILDGVGAPLDDVHFLTRELAHDGVDSDALVAYAGADGVHVGVFGVDGEFGAETAFAHNGHNLDESRFDFGHFDFKETSHETCGTSGHDDLSGAAGIAYLFDVDLDYVADVVGFAAHLVVLHHNAFHLGAADFDVNGGALFATDDGVQDFTLTFAHLVEHELLAGVVDTLHNDLFCGLSGDTRKLLGRDVLDNDVTLFVGVLDFARFFEGNLRILVLDFRDHEPVSIDLDGLLFLVQADGDIPAFAVFLLVGGRKSRFEGFDEKFLGKFTAAFEFVECLKELFVDHFFLLKPDVRLYFGFVVS